jgi:hypothetical protein
MIYAFSGMRIELKIIKKQVQESFLSSLCEDSLRPHQPGDGTQRIYNNKFIN